MFIPAAQGFGRVASSLGLNALGGAPGRDFERELGLGSTSLKGKAAINAAKARGRAIEYAGRQDRNAAIFGGAMSALGSIGSAGIESGKFGGGGGGNMSDFNSSGLFTSPPDMRFDSMYQGSFAAPFTPGGNNIFGNPSMQLFNQPYGGYGRF
jgi:hypothetical protein